MRTCKFIQVTFLFSFLTELCILVGGGLKVSGVLDNCIVSSMVFSCVARCGE